MLVGRPAMIQVEQLVAEPVKPSVKFGAPPEVVVLAAPAFEALAQPCDPVEKTSAQPDASARWPVQAGAPQQAVAGVRAVPEAARPDRPAA